jgi:prepilin-type N-terminal cleavage/methylation domain-containing protein
MKLNGQSMFRMRRRNNGNGFTPLETIHHRKRQRMFLTGFTLIELLIVCVIIPVIALAIYSSFSSGLRVWKRLNAPVSDEDTTLFFERLGVELRSTVAMKDAVFQGAESKIVFPCIISSKRMNKRTVGRVTYVFDPQAESISRSSVDYSGVFTGASPNFVKVLGNVQQAKFLFYSYDLENKRFIWRDNWMRDGIPLAVRVELQRKGSDEQDSIMRTFSIPVARIITEEERN